MLNNMHNNGANKCCSHANIEALNLVLYFDGVYLIHSQLKFLLTFYMQLLKMFDSVEIRRAIILICRKKKSLV